MHLAPAREGLVAARYVHGVHGAVDPPARCGRPTSGSDQLPTSQKTVYADFHEHVPLIFFFA